MQSSEPLTSRDGRAGLISWDELVLWLAVLINAAVVITVRYFPYTDTTNHLARYVILSEIWRGNPPFSAEFRLLPTGYIGMDVIGALLAGLLPPLAVQRIVSLVAVSLTPIAMYMLLRAKAPAARGWAVVGALLAFNWFLLIGFTAYSIGVGLAILWIAGWWKHRHRPSAAGRILLIAGALALYSVHLSAAAVILVVVSIDTVLRLAPQRFDLRHAMRDGPACTGAAVILALGALWLTGKMIAPPGPLPAYEMHVRSAWSKLTHVFAPFYSFSPIQAAVLAGSYLLSLVLFGIRHGLAWKRDPIVVAGFALFVLYLVFPATFMGAEDADVRFVLPALLLLFAGPVRGVRPKRFDLLVPLLGCLLHTGIVWHRAVAIDRELADMATILDLLPARSNVLPLVSDQRRNGRIPAYRHFVQWHTLNRQGRAPALFSGNGYGQHLAHFWIPDPLYHPGDHWGTRDFHALAWDRIREQYEFILQAGADARASTLIMEQAEPVARRGDVTLYRVRSGAPPGTTAGGRESGRQ